MPGPDPSMGIMILAALLAGAGSLAIVAALLWRRPYWRALLIALAGGVLLAPVLYLNLPATASQIGVFIAMSLASVALALRGDRRDAPPGNAEMIAATGTAFIAAWFGFLLITALDGRALEDWTLLVSQIGFIGCVAAAAILLMRIRRADNRVRRALVIAIFVIAAWRLVSESLFVIGTGQVGEQILDATLITLFSLLGALGALRLAWPARHSRRIGLIAAVFTVCVISLGLITSAYQDAVSSAIGAGAAMILVLGLLAIGAFVRGDGKRDIRRCLKCWYEMPDAAVTRCPECGRDPGADGRFFAVRRRRTWLVLGTLGLIIAVAGAYTPRVIDGDWAADAPPWLLVEIAAFKPDATMAQLVEQAMGGRWMEDKDGLYLRQRRLLLDIVFEQYETAPNARATAMWFSNAAMIRPGDDLTTMLLDRLDEETSYEQRVIAMHLLTSMSVDLEVICDAVSTRIDTEDRSLAAVLLSAAVQYGCPDIPVHAIALGWLDDAEALPEQRSVAAWVVSMYGDIGPLKSLFETSTDPEVLSSVFHALAREDGAWLAPRMLQRLRSPDPADQAIVDVWFQWFPAGMFPSRPAPEELDDPARFAAYLQEVRAAMSEVGYFALAEALGEVELEAADSGQ